MHGDGRKRLASAGEQAERFVLTRPYDVLAVPGLDSTFSAVLLFHELCCEARLPFHPDGWRT